MTSLDPNHLYNPMLDDDDEFPITSDIVNPLLEEDDEPIASPQSAPADTAAISSPESSPGTTQPVRSNPFAKLRTVVEQQEVDEKKAAGVVSDGKKKRTAAYHEKVYRRAYPTDNDAPLIRHMGKFAHTTRAISGLLYPNNADSTVNRRLLAQAEAGWSRITEPEGGRKVFTLTKDGHRLATVNGFVHAGTCAVIKPDQYYRKQPEHSLAISLIAAQIEHGGFYGFGQDASKLDGAVPHQAIISEAHVSKAWAHMVKGLAASAARNAFANGRSDTGRSVSFSQTRNRWREIYNQAAAEVEAGQFTWAEEYLIHPVLFMSVQSPHNAKADLHSSHIFDLVVRRGSGGLGDFIGVEVELSVKENHKYEAIFGNLRHVRNTSPATAPRSVVWFYKDEEVLTALRRGLNRVDPDGNAERSGFIKFRRILGTDGQPFTRSWFNI